MNHKKMLYLLIGSSILMFASIFSLNYKILGLGLLQWVIVVFVAFGSTVFKQFSLADFSGYNEKVMVESWRNKKYFKSAIYASVLPVMAVGMLMVTLIIGCMLFVF